jgi:hypothetical protein
MTRLQQIAAELKVLEPPRGKVAVCRRDIEVMLDWVKSATEAATAHKAFGSKKGKEDLKRYKNALEAVQVAYGALDPAIKPWFSLGPGFPFYEIVNVAGKPTRRRSAVERTVIDRELAKVEPLLAKARQPKRSAIKVKAARTAAFNLLIRWGHKPTGTRGGKWDRSAKILADSKAKSLHDHLSKSDIMLGYKNAMDLISRMAKEQ